MARESQPRKVSLKVGRIYRICLDKALVEASSYLHDRN